jgi:hypothetical protein
MSASFFKSRTRKHSQRSSRVGRLPSRHTPLRFEALEDRLALSTFTVVNTLNSGAGSLRQAILDANGNPGADLIRFAPAARSGTIALAGGQLSITDDLTIDGPGAGRLAVSGNDASRVFEISIGVAVSIEDLTVTHGHGLLRGGGILNAGTLTLSHAVLSDNLVGGLPGATLGAVVDAFGGGIFSTGALTVRYTRFVHNRAIGADGNPSSIGSSGLGGAIMSAGTPSAPATATVSYSTFLENQAIGGAAGIGASRAGVGGAINNTAGSCTVSHSVFRNNQAVGGIENGIPGGFGAGIGGAISNVARFGNSFLSVSESTLTSNRAIGGAAGTGTIAQNGRGGAIANYIFGGVAPPVTVTAAASIDHCTLLGNQAIGGFGPTGGIGQGGGIANENGGILTVSNSLIALNRAIGGAGEGGNGGNGLGGGIFNGGPSPVGTPSLTLQQSLVMLNRAEGGASNGGSAGLGVGGGLYLAPGGVATADLMTAILVNSASTSDDDVFGILVKTGVQPSRAAGGVAAARQGSHPPGYRAGPEWPR